MEDCKVHSSDSTKTPIHPAFNDPEADVTFRSMDGVLFHLQRKYLEANTGAFPGSEFDTRGEITHLAETSKVLEILFQFVYPRRHPEVEELDFPILAAVAEAAEKYEVFVAMNICRLQLKQFIPEHAAAVLAHATKHDYPKIIQETVPHLARSPVVKVAEMLPPGYAVAWIRYHDSWNSIFEAAFKSIITLKTSSPNQGPRPGSYFAGSLEPQACHSCMILMIITIQELKDLESTKELFAALATPRPSPLACLSNACRYTSVISKICADMKSKMDSIPPFSTFLSSRDRS